MQFVMARKVVGMTDLREPKKVLEEAGSDPVAVMNRNDVVGYFVPAAAVNRIVFRDATIEELDAILDSQDELTAEGVAYLKDK
jgi:antitoxin StbD